jgi:hypothetical protein
MRLWLEAATVMSLRCWGVPATDAETRRMIAEKPPAFAQAAVVAGFAWGEALLRQPFDAPGAASAATGAWLRALTGVAATNRRRLLRRR